MKEIMNIIFTESNFKVIDLPNNQDTDSFFAISLDNQKINYYLVLFLDDISSILKNQIDFNKFYENIMELEEEYDPQMDKNLSMIICAKRNTLEPKEDINQAIYRIEEDPYFFKKYVLTYTQEEVKMIHHEAEVSALGLSLDFIYDILYSHDKFLSFKSNPYLESTYNLVSKLFIKLPFLNLKNANRQIDDLSDNIDSSLSLEQTKLRNKSLDSLNNLMQDSDNLRGKIIDFLEVSKDGDL